MKTFCLILACASLTTQVTANNLIFSQRLYDAIEVLYGVQNDNNQYALELMLSAQSFSDQPEALEELRAAQLSLLPWQRFHPKNSSEEDIAKTVGHLREALRANRIELNRSYHKEVDLIEGLIIAHLFPGYSNVRLSYDNIDREKAVLLMATYLADPRSVRHDPGVHELMTGLRHDGTTSDRRIIFHLPDQRFMLPPGEDPSELEQELQDLIDQFITEDSPIRMEIETVYEAGDAIDLIPGATMLRVKMEVAGFEYAPLGLSLLKNTLAVALDNRYLFLASDLLESVGRELVVSNYGGQQSEVSATLRRVGEKVTTAELKLREFLEKRRWFSPSVERVKTYLRLKCDHHLASMRQTRDRRIKQIQGSSMSSAEKQAAVRGQRETFRVWKASRDQWLKTTLEGIDRRVTELKSTARYKRMDLATRERAKFLAAEKVANQNNRLVQQINKDGIFRGVAKWQHRRTMLFTADRLLKAFALTLAGWHITEGRRQFAREECRVDQRFFFLPTRIDVAKCNMIWQHYGVQTISSLIYAYPPLAEFGVLFDFWGDYIVNTGLWATGTDLRVPTVSDMLTFSIKTAEHWTFYFHGTDRFRLMADQLRLDFNLPDLKLQRWHRGEGGHDLKWTSRQIRRYDRCLRLLDDPAIYDKTCQSPAEEKIAFETHIREASLGYLRFFYAINQLSENAYYRELGKIQFALYSKLMGKQTGMLAVANDLNLEMDARLPELGLKPEDSVRLGIIRTLPASNQEPLQRKAAKKIHRMEVDP